MERVLGQASVDIRANDKRFINDLKKMLKGIKDQTVNIYASVDTKQAEKQLEDFKKQQNKSKSTIEISAKASVDKAKEDLKKFRESEQKKTGTLKFDAKVSFKEARQNIKSFYEEVDKRRPLNLKAKVTFTEARKDIRNFKDKQSPIGLKANLELDPSEARATIEAFRDRYMNSAPVVLQATMAFGMARTQIAAFRREQDGRQITLIVDANTNPAKRAIRRLERDIAKEPIIAPTMLVNPHTGEVFGRGYNPFRDLGTPSSIDIPVNVGDSDAFDSMDVLNKRIQGLRDEGINFPIRVNTNQFDREVERLEQKVRAYDLGMEILAKPKLSDRDIAVLRRQIGRTFPELGDYMAAELSSRVARRITGRGNPFMSMFRDSALRDAVKGFSNSLTGVLPLDLVRDRILTTIAGMDGLAASAGTVVTAVGGIGAGLTAASGFAANLITDLGQVAGIAALLPAAFAANQIRIWTRDMAYAGMSTAIFSDNAKAVEEALAGMTPVMRYAAEYLREFLGEISNVTQNAYWDQMGSEIQMTAEILKGTLLKNFSRMGEVMALNHIEVLKQIVAFEEMGKFDATFTNIIDAFENMRKGMGLVTEALLQLTYEGSKKLPDLANRFNELAEGFRDFIKINSENGNILKWIDVSMQRIGELGSILGDTVEIIAAIGQAAEQAGIGGLTELADAFERVSEMVNNANAQSLMVDMFRDSRIAAEELSQGLANIWDGLIDSMPVFTQIMIIASESIRDLFEGVGTMLSETGMLDGFQKLAEGVRNAISGLDPAFRNIGEILGMMAEMGGAIVENLVPGINTATEMVKLFLEGFHGGFIDLLPVMQDVASAFHHLLIEPIRILGEMAGNTMSAIAGLPDEFIMLATAFGILVGPMMIARTGFGFISDSLNGIHRSGALGSISTKIESVGNAIKSVNFSAFNSGVSNMGRGVASATKGVGSAVNVMGGQIATSMLTTVGAFDSANNASKATKGHSDKMVGAWRNAKTSVKASVDSMKSGFGSLKGAISGLSSIGMSLGITAGLSVALAALADAQAGADAAKKSISDYAATFDSEIGAFGDSAVKHFEDRLSVLGQDWGTKLGFADDFKDTADKVGISIEDIAENFRGGKQDVEDYAGTWNHVGAEIDKSLNSSQWDFKTKFQATREVMNDLSDDMLAKMDITREQINSMNDVELTRFVEGMRQAGEEGLEALDKIEDFSEGLSGIKDIDLGNVWDWANNGGAEMDGVREALSQANEQVDRLDENFKVLGDTSSSISQKLSAFKDNLKLTGAETFTDTGGLKEYYAGLQEVKSAYDKIKEATDGNIGSLMTFSTETGKLNAQFDFTQQAARDLHDALGKDAEGIQAIGISAYDTALKNTGSVEKAIGAAKDAMAGPVEELRNRLREMGGLSEDEINSIIDSLGLLPEDVEMALSVDGAAEARRQIIETQLAAEAISRGDFKVYLEVMSDDAKKALADFLGTADLNNKVEVEAALKKKGFDMDYNQLMTQVALAPDEVSMLAMLEDRASGPAKEINETIRGMEGNKNISVDLTNNVQTEVDTISKSLNDMTKNPKNVELRTNAEETAEKALAELKKLDDANPELNLDADISRLEQQIENAKFAVSSVEDRDVVIEAIDKATPALGAWNNMVAEGKNSVLNVVDNASDKVRGFNQMEAEDKEAVIEAIDEANPKAMAWQRLSLDEKMAVLSVYDEASQAVNNFNTEAELKTLYGNMLPQDDITGAVEQYNSLAFLDTKLGVLEAIDRATPAVGFWNTLTAENKQAIVSAVDAASPVVDGFNAMNLKDQDAVLRAVDEATPKVSLWNSLTPAEKRAVLSAMDEANPLVDEWNASTLQGKLARLGVDDQASPVIATVNGALAAMRGPDLSASLNISQPLGAINTLRDSNVSNKKFEILTSNATAMGMINETDRNDINNKIFDIITSNTDANGKISNTKAKEINDKLFDIITSNTDANGKINAVKVKEILDKKFDIKTSAYNANREVNSVKNNSIADKVFGITARINRIINGSTTSNRMLEEGGIFSSAGVQTFANGGMSKAIQSIQMNSFAGGTEKHVAQIAKGGWPYRVWAEPETGGEAYIPLAKSKRKRSMKILEQVAKYFGMNLMKFNQGGVVRKATGSSGMVRTFANGGTDLAQALSRDRQTISDGFRSLRLDLFSVFGSPEKSPMVRSMEGIEKTLRDFATEYRKSAPKERAKALQAVTLLTSQQKLSRAWSNKNGSEVTANYIAKQARFNETVRKGGKTIPMGSQWTMADMEKALSIVSKNLEQQKAILEKIKSDRDSMQKSIADNLFSSFNLSDTVQSADSTGWRAPTSSADIATYANNKLATMKKYNSRMKELIKSGYNKAIVMDIASMKPEDAIYLADALLKDKTYMSTINSAYTEMFGAGGNRNINGMTGEGYTAGLANVTGKTLADSFYGAGISASQGLVDGLTKDVSALERAARIMADQLTNSFKSIMGIKSPSRVMMNLGKFIPEGLAIGIDSGASMVSRSMTNMVRASDFDITARPVGYTPRHSNGIIGGASSAGPTIHVHPSKGLSEEQIGQAASRELLHRTLG